MPVSRSIARNTGEGALAALSARAIARGVRAGRFTRGAVADAARARLAGIAGLEAVTDTFDPPLERGGAGPLAGVPMLVKDLAFPVAGRPAVNGSAYPGAVAARNAILLDRYLDAGAQVLGRTHSPEMGGTSSCESLRWGLATSNPYAPGLSSGGSSGGAAVAVATGAVPVAQANDAGGSITIPAALCGVVGLKPTRGLVPLGPDRIEGAAGFAAQNVLTRDIGDTALALAVGAERPELARIAPLGKAPAIGLVIAPADGGGMRADISGRLVALADRLSAAGYRIDPAELPPVTDALAAAERSLRLASVAAMVAGWEAETGIAARAEHFEPASWARIKAGRRVSGAEVLAARDRLLDYENRVLGLFDRFEIVMSPALNAAAPALHALSLMRPDAETGPINRDYVCFARVWNLTGAPSLCLPLLRDAQNRPEGVLFAGPPGSEARLLSLGAALEAAIGWQHDHLMTDFPRIERTVP